MGQEPAPSTTGNPSPPVKDDDLPAANDAANDLLDVIIAAKYGDEYQNENLDDSEDTKQTMGFKGTATDKSLDEDEAAQIKADLKRASLISPAVQAMVMANNLSASCLNYKVDDSREAEGEETAAGSSGEEQELDLMEIVAARCQKNLDFTTKAGAGSTAGATVTDKSLLAGTTGKKEQDLDLMEIVAARTRQAAANPAAVEEEDTQIALPPAEGSHKLRVPNEQESVGGSNVEAVLGLGPGAHNMTPQGAAPPPHTDPQFDGDDEESNPQGSFTRRFHQVPQESTTDIDSLPSANFVFDESASPVDVEDAMPMDLEAARRKRESWNRQKTRLGMGLVFLCAVAIAVSVTAVFVTRQNKSNALVTLPVNDTLEPTSSPTRQLPPIDSLQTLYDDIPDKSKESLYSASTPQRKAWEWLLKHQNITNLEEWRKKQLFAMATFYYAFDGPHWPEPIRKNWLDDTKEECSWPTYDKEQHEQIALYHRRPYPDFNTCNGAGELTMLNLYHDGIPLNLTSPFIPPEVGLLTSLIFWVFQSNTVNDASLADVLPQELVQLPNLAYVLLFGNKLGGTIPKYVGMMTGLETLYLGGNELTGTIPKEISGLSKLQGLTVGRNSLHGPIPTELGLMSSLTDLVLRSNTLTGTIPSQLGLLTDMFRFNLFSNSLSGWIPSELGQMINTTWLMLQDNLLAGPIPSELLQLSQLKIVDLTKLPLLSGVVPDHLCYLRSDDACSYQFAKVADLELLLPCRLGFECTELLCGCDCECLMGVAVTNTSLRNRSF